MDNVGALVCVFSLLKIIEKGEKNQDLIAKTLKLQKSHFKKASSRLERLHYSVYKSMSLPEDQSSVPRTHIWQFTTARTS